MNQSKKDNSLERAYRHPTGCREALRFESLERSRVSPLLFYTQNVSPGLVAWYFGSVAACSGASGQVAHGGFSRLPPSQSPLWGPGGSVLLCSLLANPPILTPSSISGCSMLEQAAGLQAVAPWRPAASNKVLASEAGSGPAHAVFYCDMTTLSPPLGPFSPLLEPFYYIDTRTHTHGNIFGCHATSSAPCFEGNERPVPRRKGGCNETPRMRGSGRFVSSGSPREGLPLFFH